MTTPPPIVPASGFLAPDLAQVVPYVRVHAEAEAPRECCGVVVREPHAERLTYIACNNLAPIADPANSADFFVIDPKGYARAEDTGEVVAIAHSHVYLPATPTPADLTGIERSGLPWLIVNHPTGQYTISLPVGYSAPLYGRAFVHGVHDCYALVRDYFAQLGIALNDYPRTYGWWDDPSGPDLYRENFAREGFAVVLADTLREHDLILMRVRALRENHMAVYLGDGVIAHHLMGQLSRRETYQEFYQRRTTAVLRHRAFL
jgi:proteasome lid subunit RPN8/RPN11